MNIRLLIYITFLLSLLYSNNIVSQSNNEKNYFPLAVGNQWVYEEIHNFFIDTLSIIDSQIIDGKTYYLAKENYSQFFWLRMENNKVYIVDTFATHLDSLNINEFILYDFSANIGDNWLVKLKSEWADCDYSGIISLESISDTVYTPYNVFYNSFRFYRLVPCYDAGRFQEWFADGIGKVFYEEYSFGRDYRCYLKSFIGTTDIKNFTDVKIDNQFKVWQNYPNPFNPSTIINYQLPKSEIVTITIYDLLGKEVKVIDHGFKSAGLHSIKFNSDNLPSGAYFYLIKAGNFIQIKKMMILK